MGQIVSLFSTSYFWKRHFADLVESGLLEIQPEHEVVFFLQNVIRHPKGWGGEIKCVYEANFVPFLGQFLCFSALWLRGKNII